MIWNKRNFPGTNLNDINLDWLIRQMKELDEAFREWPHSPRIENGEWYVYDEETGEYVSTGVPATGEQGPTGPQGPQGPQGVPGPSGMSAFYVAEYNVTSYDDIETAINDGKFVCAVASSQSQIYYMLCGYSNGVDSTGDYDSIIFVRFDVDGANNKKLYKLTCKKYTVSGITMWDSETLPVELADDVLEPIEANIADLKSAVTLYTGNAQINFVKDKYIVTSGRTVDITSPVNSSSGYGYAVIDCSEGDKFTVTSSGGQNPRAWCFIDASGNSLSKADSGVAVNNVIITAPANSAKLVINAKYATEKSYYGEFLTNRVEDLSDTFENRDPLFNKIIKLPNNDSFFEEKPTNAGIYTKLGNNAFEISGGTGTTFYNYPIHGTKRVVVGTDAQTLARVLPEDFIEIPTGGDWGSTTFSLGIKMYIESTVSTGSVELVIICANIINGEFVDTPVVLARGQVNTKYGTCINRLRDAGFAPFEKYTHYAIFVRSKNRSTGNSTKIYLETVQSPRVLSNTLNSASMVETSMKATRNYAVNSLIIIETKLYKVISAISSGEDIIVGTNVQETTILGTLTYLLNHI